MAEIDKLAYALNQFAGLSEEDFKLSSGFWLCKNYKKGEFYNLRGNVCTYLGFVIDGVFRSYTINEKAGEEKNVFLYSANGFVVPFKSFVNQIPCDYHTQAMTDASIIFIRHTDLVSLYSKSHQQEKFGRLLAQEAFNVTMTRIEGFLLKSPEERYLDLMKDHPDIFNNVQLYHISSYFGNSRTIFEPHQKAANRKVVLLFGQLYPSGVYPEPVEGFPPFCHRK